MDLQLSEAEHELLLRLLDHALGELRVEVRRTRTPAFHDGLAADEETLKGLIARLQQAA
jgi:hypothetical protein